MLVTIDTQYFRPEAAAAYLRVEGQEAAFIETNTRHAVPHLLAALEAHGLAPSAVRYVIVTHAHLDHASGASALLQACPQATLVCHPMAKKHLVDPSRLVESATQVYGPKVFAELYGSMEPIAEARVREAADGDTLALGQATLRLLHTLGHARHHLVVDDPSHDTVFTGDSFGLVFPQLQLAGRFAIPTTSPVDFDGPEALKAIDRILGLGRGSVCLTHYGQYEDLSAIAAQLKRWLEVSLAAVETCVREAQAEPKPFLAATLRRHLERVAGESGLTLTPEALAILEMDLELNAQGLAVAVSRRLRPR